MTLTSGGRLPALSTAYADGDRPTFVRLVGRNLVSIVTLTVLASIVMVVLGEIAIGILLGGGAFGPDDVSRTAAVLSAFALSVPFESTSQLLSRAIFATRHTLFQAIASDRRPARRDGRDRCSSVRLLVLPIGFAVGQATKAGPLAIVLGGDSGVTVTLSRCVSSTRPRSAHRDGACAPAGSSRTDRLSRA